MNAARCFGQATIVLAAISIARAFGLLGPTVISAGLLTASLMLIAWRARATAADLGLAREDMRAGVRYGVGAFGLVLLILVAIALIPGTNGFLDDSRADISGGRLIFELTISIVLLTAIPEEFAFRGVLLGSGVRLWGPWRASLITSALFGLWHIVPTLHTMSDNHAISGAFQHLCRPSTAGDRNRCCNVRRRPRVLVAEVAIAKPNRAYLGSHRDQRPRPPHRLVRGSVVAREGRHE